MWEMDTAGEGTIRELGVFKRPPGNRTDPNPPNTGSSSTAVMYEPGKILKVGRWEGQELDLWSSR